MLFPLERLVRGTRLVLEPFLELLRDVRLVDPRALLLRDVRLFLDRDVRLVLELFRDVNMSRYVARRL